MAHHLSEYAQLLAEAMREDTESTAKGLRSLATGHRGMIDWLREDLDGEAARLDAAHDAEIKRLESSASAHTADISSVIAQLQTALAVHQSITAKAMDDERARHTGALQSLQARHQIMSERLGMLAGTLHAAAEDAQAGITPKLPEPPPSVSLLPVDMRDDEKQDTDSLYLALTKGDAESQ